MVVVQWFVNDIEGAAAREGMEYVPELPLMNIPGLNLLLNRSYFFNYLYVHTPWQTEFGYGDYLKNVYGNEEVLLQYESEFGQLVSWVVGTNEADMLVVLFPSMSQPEATQEYVEYVKGLCDRHKLPWVDMSPTIKALSPEDRRVNRYDDHPSEKVHELTAEQVYTEFERLGWLEEFR